MPTPRTIGCGRASSTVTSRPRLRHVAATSAPMNPAPITQTRAPASSRSRIAWQSSIVRSVNTPASAGCPGSVRGVDPVAMTNPSNSSSVPPASVTVRVLTFSAVAETPSRSSRSRSSYGTFRSTT